jgi:hypothetical protein
MKLRWTGGAIAALAAMLPAQLGQASSHREAPFIARQPKVDGTDFYMFRSYEPGRAEFVTLIANYQPLQDSYGGPNYFSMDPDAIYEIHVDTDGDAVEDLTFQFDFDAALQGGTGIRLPVGTGANQKMVAIPFVNANVSGPITAPASPAQNVLETYQVKLITGDRRTGEVQSITRASGGETFDKPLDYIGTKSLGNAAAYNAYAAQFMYDIEIPGCDAPAGQSPRVFVGQRQEGFAVNLGQIFDLVNACSEALAPGSCAGGQVFDITGDADQGRNIVGNKNVTSIALEVPRSCLAPTGDDGIIGAWTTASVRQARVINPAATFDQPSREGGPWVQVSRLGLPLINEVVIGLPDKDKFNGSEPKDDVANFADYVTNPTLPEVVELLFGPLGVAAPENIPRTDLVDSLLLGIPVVNRNGASPVPADMLRLNTSDALGPPTPRASQTYIGAALCLDRRSSEGGTQLGFTLDPTNAGCDPSGFPNGRRPGDDTVDASLDVVMGFLAGTDYVPTFALLTDGAMNSPASFGNAFPYLNPPLRGSP